MTAPMMASLSPSGMSAQVTVTPEKNRRGSGVCGRIWACLFFTKDAEIQEGVTTGSIISHASRYWGKSELAAMTCVSSSSLILPSRFNGTIWAPLSSRVDCSYWRVSQRKEQSPGAWYLECSVLVQVFANDNRDLAQGEDGDGNWAVGHDADACSSRGCRLESAEAEVDCGVWCSVFAVKSLEYTGLARRNSQLM